MTASAGVVLAGGRSSRLGAPKAGLAWHGSTLLHRTVSVVAEAVAGPVVVVRAPGQPLPGLPAGTLVTEDPREGKGAAPGDRRRARGPPRSPGGRSPGCLRRRDRHAVPARGLCPPGARAAGGGPGRRRAAGRPRLPSAAGGGLPCRSRPACRPAGGGRAAAARRLVRRLHGEPGRRGPAARGPRAGGRRSGARLAGQRQRPGRVRDRARPFRRLSRSRTPPRPGWSRCTS
jgi:hypothetical protein